MFTLLSGWTSSVKYTYWFPESSRLWGIGVDTMLKQNLCVFVIVVGFIKIDKLLGSVFDPVWVFHMFLMSVVTWMPTSSSLWTRESSESSSTCWAVVRCVINVSGKIGEEVVVECSKFDKNWWRNSVSVVDDEFIVDSIVFSALLTKVMMVQLTLNRYDGASQHWLCGLVFGCATQFGPSGEKLMSLEHRGLITQWMDRPAVTIFVALRKWRNQVLGRNEFYTLNNHNTLVPLFDCRTSLCLWCRETLQKVYTKPVRLGLTHLPRADSGLSSFLITCIIEIGNKQPWHHVMIGIIPYVRSQRHINQLGQQQRNRWSLLIVVECRHGIYIYTQQEAHPIKSSCNWSHTFLPPSKDCRKHL